MSLLVDLSVDSLDPGYASAALRRRDRDASRAGDDGAGGGQGRARLSVLGPAVLAATLLIVLAAVQTRATAPAAARSRAVLAAAVARQSATVSALERDLAGLRTEQAALRDATLLSSGEGAALSRRLAEAELVLGTTTVRGPGLKVTLGDASTSSARNRVQDRDIQDVVNALWQAGAEAVAVNGARLSAQSAIRMAGDAILVDFRPLVSPYVVEAIGDPVALETAFGTSRAAARMRGYVQLYGLSFSYLRASRLQLSGAPDTALRFARPARPAASPSATPSSKGPQ